MLTMAQEHCRYDHQYQAHNPNHHVRSYRHHAQGTNHATCSHYHGTNCQYVSALIGSPKVLMNPDCASAWLQVINACNLLCHYCYMRGRGIPEEHVEVWAAGAV